MQVALLETTVLAISVPKRGLMAFGVKKVLGVPAFYGVGGGGPVWFVYSDPTLDWLDVRQLIAIVENIDQFLDDEDEEEPFLPDGFPDVLERKGIGPFRPGWSAARNAVRGWTQSRLPPMPPDGEKPDGSWWDLEVWFARPWLRINNTVGLVPVDENGDIIIELAVPE